MDHCHQKEKKREAGRKKACSEWFMEAHESQFENVPFCTAVAATWLRSQLDPTNSQLYTKAQMDKKLQRLPWKNMWRHTLHLSPFQNASLPTWCECSYQIFLHNSWAAWGQGGQAGQTCGCFTWRTCVQVCVVEDNEMDSSQFVLWGNSWRLNAKVKYLLYAWDLQIK